MKPLVEKLNETSMIAEFAKSENIPPKLVSGIKISPRGDAVANVKGKEYMLGQVDREADGIFTNPMQIQSYIAANNMQPYEYKDNELAPMYVDGNPVKRISPELNSLRTQTAYAIEMQNAYNLHITPVEFDGQLSYAFSVGTDQNIRDISPRFLSKGWDAIAIESIYDKLSSMDTIPVLKDNIVHDPWDEHSATILAQYMEEMVHPVKSEDVNARFKALGNEMEFVNPQLYPKLAEVAKLYESPADIQKMAEAIIIMDREIREPERVLTREDQHRFEGEKLDALDTIEKDDFDTSDSYEEHDEHDSLDDCDSIDIAG